MCSLFILVMISTNACVLSVSQPVEKPATIDSILKVIDTKGVKSNRRISDYPKDVFNSKNKVNTDSLFEKVQSKYNSDEFDYHDVKKEGATFFERLQKWISKLIKKFLPNFSSASEDTIVTILRILGLLAILLVIYTLFFTKNSIFRREKAEKFTGDIAYIEQHLESVDIKSYLDEAIRTEKWNDAIRYLQLANLQLLAKKGWITWDHRKTNQELMNEISDENIRNRFKSTTSIFNYVWFGDFKIDKEEFDRFYRDFNHFKSTIS